MSRFRKVGTALHCLRGVITVKKRPFKGFVLWDTCHILQRIRGSRELRCIAAFAEGTGRDTVLLFENRIKIGYGGKAYRVADRQDGFVCILQTVSGLLQTDVIQVVGHRAADIMLEGTAHIRPAEVERFQNSVEAVTQIVVHVKAAEQFSEPDRIVGYIVLDLFHNQNIQKRDTERSDIGIFKCGAGIQKKGSI